MSICTHLKLKLYICIMPWSFIKKTISSLSLASLHSRAPLSLASLCTVTCLSLPRLHLHSRSPLSPSLPLSIYLARLPPLFIFSHSPPPSIFSRPPPPLFTQMIAISYSNTNSYYQLYRSFSVIKNTYEIFQLYKSLSII